MTNSRHGEFKHYSITFESRYGLYLLNIPGYRTRFYKHRSDAEKLAKRFYQALDWYESQIDGRLAAMNARLEAVQASN